MADTKTVDVAATTPEVRKAFVTFERSVQVRPYETAKASIIVQADVPPTAGDSEADLKALEAAFFQAKSLVFEQLGLEFKVENGVVLEVLRQAFGPVEVVKTSDAPASNETYVDKDGNVRQSKFEKRQCPDCGGEMWDNRTTKKGNQPDFKCKDKSCDKAVWVNRKAS